MMFSFFSIKVLLSIQKKKKFVGETICGGKEVLGCEIF